MPLIKRLSNLFTADAHAVLDLVEDPHNMLKQAIRDMEEDIIAQKKYLQRQSSKRESLSELTNKLSADIQQVDQDLDLCINSKNTPLARSLVRKKLMLNRQQEEIEQTLVQTDKQILEGQSTLDDRLSKLENIKLKAKVFASPHTQPNHQQTSTAYSISEDEIEVALLKEIQARKK